MINKTYTVFLYGFYKKEVTFDMIYYTFDMYFLNIDFIPFIFYLQF